MMVLLSLLFYNRPVMIEENLLQHKQSQEEASDQESEDSCKPPIIYTSISDSNFIKSLRLGQEDKSIICIFQGSPFTVQFRKINEIKVDEAKIDFMYVDEKCEEGMERGWDLGVSDDQIMGEIRLETVPYGCLEFGDGLWIVSNKGMPPRVYKNYHDEQKAKIRHIGSFLNKKKNSQQYLSPIQLASHKSRLNYAIGGGRRFLCSYNLQKLVQDQIYPSFDKTNISAIELLNENTLLIGTFEGSLGMMDLREIRKKEDSNGLVRPHVDAVMSVAVGLGNQHIFASGARKDNYVYIWDSRYFGQEAKYLSELDQPRHGNQRISLSFSPDSKILYSGSQNSQIIAWQHEKQQFNVSKWVLPGKNTVNSVVCTSESGHVIFSTGTRVFADIQGHNQMENETRGSNESKGRNILGAIKTNG